MQLRQAKTIALYITKTPDLQKKIGSLRGSWRTRTAVAGFADQCLATRPRNRCDSGCKISNNLFAEQIFISSFLHKC